jgi:hypothetical protein
MTETKPTRRARFKRATVNVSLTERDREIIRHVYRHRFLTSDHIIALVDAGRPAMLKRLALLYHAGYLDRPRIQVTRLGNHPMVYALGNEGAEVLAQELDRPLSSVDWTSKNRETKGVFLEHTLMVANFMVLVELACRKTEGVEFIRPEAIVGRRTTPPAATNKLLSWNAEVQGSYPGFKKKQGLVVVPDSAFGLKVTRDGKSSLSFFFLEADRSTMPVKSVDLGRSSFYKKMVGYWESWTQGLFSKNFGFKKARLLTLTISTERIQSLIQANVELDPKGQGLRMFLFAPDKAFSLDKPEGVLGQVWVNGCREATGLVE